MREEKMTKADIDLINEKFNSTHTIIESNQSNLLTELGSLREILEGIKAQTTKTNGRVTKLEDTVRDIQLNDALHTVNCPLNKKFEEMDEDVTAFKEKMSTDLQEYNFFKKYPKLTVAIVAIVVITMLSGMIQITEAVKLNLFGRHEITTEVQK